MSSQIKPLTATELEGMFAEIFSGPSESLLATITRWFSPSYIQVTDGHTSNFSEFVEHITKVRSLVQQISVKVQFFVQDGHKVADRHTVEVKKTDGSTSLLEVLFLAERDEEGKFVRVWETSRTVEGIKGSAELARAR